MKTHPASIFLFTALACEAKPLIDCFKLKKQTSIKPFTIFINEHIILTITGIGKTAMAAGVAYTQALFPSGNHPILLNIGIAGHQDHSIGSIFLADKITDAGSGRSYYPPLAFTPPCPTHEVITFVKAQEKYPETALCDMEASAFYETATRFSTGELIHCLKVISDNASSPTEHINPQHVSLMISEQTENINKILDSLTQLAINLYRPEIEEFDELLNRYRFTVSEQIQLKKLLARWHLVTCQQLPVFSTEKAKTGKDFIRFLNQTINKADFYL